MTVHVFEFWLTLEAPDYPYKVPPMPKVTKGQPTVRGKARAMKMRLEVPRAVFMTPSLSATVQVAEPDVEAIHIDAEAATEALRHALGCDVHVSVVNEEDFAEVEDEEDA